MTRYKINSPYVVSEVFADNEAAIINLKTGTYHSLNTMATAIWTLVESGANLDELTAFAIDNHDVDRETANADIEQFLESLVKADLIVPTETEREVHVSESASSKKRDYERPVLESYEDMQELLLLDPIHEVDETTWLHKKAGG
ncbi:MAG: hypothetical protein DMF63_16280 [Acidobacteria bacterium]|nr:MAG: hypothetical protein DMF63_16280 [Acidobacteriota bacterium]